MEDNLDIFERVVGSLSDDQTFVAELKKAYLARIGTAAPSATTVALPQGVLIPRIFAV